MDVEVDPGDLRLNKIRLLLSREETGQWLKAQDSERGPFLCTNLFSLSKLHSEMPALLLPCGSGQVNLGCASFSHFLK